MANIDSKVWQLRRVRTMRGMFVSSVPTCSSPMYVDGCVFIILTLLIATLAASTTNPPPDANNNPTAAMPTAEPAIVALIDWIRSKGGYVSGIEIGRTSRGGMRGVIASRDLKKGEIVTRTPFSTLINIEHAFASNDAGRVLNDEMSDLSDTTIMGTFLAYEYLKGPNSQWAPYIQSLPPPPSPSLAAASANAESAVHSDIPSPLYYPPKLLEELRGSSVYGFAVKRQSAVEASYRKVSSFFTSHNAARNESGGVTQSLFQWGLSILWSRTFGVKVKDKKGEWQNAPCFVPVADLFNSGDTFGVDINVDCHTTRDSTAFECFTTQPIKRGTECRVIYGYEMGNQQLLLDYGFTMKHNNYTSVMMFPNTHIQIDNTPYQSVETMVVDFQNRVLPMFKLDKPPFFTLPALSANSLKPRYGSALPLPLPLLIYVRTKTFTMNILDNWRSGKANANDVTEALKRNEPFSLGHEKLVVEILMKALTAMIRAYPTTLNNDKLQLFEAEKTDGYRNDEEGSEWCPKSFSKEECYVLFHILRLRTHEKLIIRDYLKMLAYYEKRVLKKWRHKMDDDDSDHSRPLREEL